MFITICANPPLRHDRRADILQAVVFLPVTGFHSTDLTDFVRSTDQCEALAPSPSSISFSLDESSNP